MTFIRYDIDISGGRGIIRLTRRTSEDRIAGLRPARRMPMEQI
jgi:hypothetical protein